MGGQNIKQHTGQDYAELARLKEGPARDTLLGGIPLTRVSVFTHLFTESVMQVPPLNPVKATLRS